jgi:hypothetical protein
VSIDQPPEPELPAAADAPAGLASETEAAPAGRKPSTLRERLVAALIHLSISALAVASLAAAMWFALYPPPYFWIDGGASVLRILVLADVILGPALTFVVFNRAKPEWKRDLAIIALVQLLAFAYGTSTMVRYRPVFAAYADGVFFAVTWPRVEAATHDLAKPHALREGHWAPSWVIIDLPADVKAAQELRRQSNPDGNRSLPGMGDLYLPLNPATAPRVFDGSADVEILAKTDKSIAAELARVKAAHPGPMSRYAFVPLAGRDDLILVMFDRASAQPVDYLR